MSLINKMLQDLDKRHAGDGGGKTLTKQLRPVAAGRRDWKRIAWEVGGGLVLLLGWAGWVYFQVSPRSVVTALAFQSKGPRPLGSGGPHALAPPPVPLAAPVVAAPVQAAVAPPAAAATAPTSVAAASESVTTDGLKLATEIGTPFAEKKPPAKGRPESKRAAASADTPAPANRAAKQENSAHAASSAAASKAPGPSSIDKQVRLQSAAERAESEFRKATGLLNQGRVAEAIDGYKLTLQQDAGHAAARQALVGLLLENRRIDEAQQFLQEGLRLHPDRSAYAMLLARIQVERGDLQGAHDLLSKHAGTAANDADYHAFDAALLQRLGRHKEAVTAYQAALAVAPRAGLWWMGMAISMQSDGRAAEALDAFQRARSVGGLSTALLAFVDQRVKQLQ
ncbi:MAG: tetratricopeptide repeat protein [Betaproteobacteria bacterium]|nr:MAG: tetratricopeptide repeat protein [Betaproteobacteria bacterium]